MLDRIIKVFMWLIMAFIKVCLIIILGTLSLFFGALFGDRL